MYIVDDNESTVVIRDIAPRRTGAWRLDHGVAFLLAVVGHPGETPLVGLGIASVLLQTIIGPMHDTWRLPRKRLAP